MEPTKYLWIVSDRSGLFGNKANPLVNGKINVVTEERNVPMLEEMLRRKIGKKSLEIVSADYRGEVLEL